MNQSWTRYLPAFLREKVEGRISLQKAIGNTGWLMGDQVLRMAVGLLVGAWLARYLGPGKYGEFSYAIAFTMLFLPAATLGIDSIVQRKIILDPSCSSEVIGTSFFLSLFGGFVVFVLGIMGIFLVRPGDDQSHWLVGITVAGAIPQAFVAIEYWFESQVQAKAIVCAKISAFLIVSVVKVYLILIEAPLVAFAWAGLAEMTVAAIGLVISYQVGGYRITSWSFSQTTAGELLKDSWPILIVIILSMLSLRIDQVMLGEMAGKEEVGIYSVAVRLAEPWFFLPYAICASVFPAILESWSSNKDQFYEQMQKLYNLMVLIAYAIAIPVTFLSAWMVKVLFGTAYIEAGPLLAVLIWTGLFTSLASARTLFLITMNWTRLFMLSLGLGCLLNIGLNFFLIPLYGAMGAVIASLISYWFSLHGVCFLFKPLRKTGWMLTKAIIFPKVW